MKIILKNELAYKDIDGRSILDVKYHVRDEQKQAMNTSTAIEFIKRKGIPMSKSKLYKLVTAKDYSIPFRRAGPRLIFYAHELELWSNSQILDPREIIRTSTFTIATSARKK